MQVRWRLRPLASIFVGTLGLVSTFAQAQTSTSRVEGLRENNPGWHALTGARVVTAPGKVIENGTIIVKDGVIVSVAANAPAPAGAKVWKLEGRTVYAGFIDMASSIGVPSGLAASAPAAPGRPTSPRVINGRAIAADNIRVHPEQDVAKQLEPKSDDVKNHRELGFATVLATPTHGIFRGQSALLSLNSNDNAKNMVINARVAQHMANELEAGGRSGYPNSLMGVIAQVRQTFYDAQWYQRATETKLKTERPQINDSLEALKPVINGRQPVIYATDNEQAYQRIAKIRDEFGLKVIVQGNGYEYRRTNHLKLSGMPVIVPLLFPNAPEVDNPDLVLDTSLEGLQHWEQAPSNLAYVEKAGVEFAVTPAGLKDAKKEFWTRLRQAIRRGLSIEQALASLTTVPAKLLGEQKRLGSIAPGQMANLVVASGDLFSDDKSNVEITFVEGKPYTTESYNRFELRGTWNVVSGGKTAVWNITGTAAKPMLTVDGVNVELTLKDSQVLAKYTDKAGEHVILADGRDSSLQGTERDAQGQTKAWSATRSKVMAADTTPAKPEKMPASLSNTYPAGPFAIATPERVSAILIKNATIWTSGKAGKLEQSDMLVVDGKISAIGKDLKAPANAKVIDANGKHVTPGIIDAHSHTAMMQGINEATSSITAEVRVGDIIDASSINIYRQLAGGVTTANVLHGSANTVGGQNQVIKMRWGSDAEGLKLDGAFPGIKFALGENVKQSNWGNESTGRYPQTRMGVEQILRSAFLAARAYKEERDAWKKSPSNSVEPRRDLQLDTLVELLERKRMIHIHSYRQDEILMFARIAQEFNLLVGTFQHVMEGYKVADVIAGLGAGGSTFSDWWGYKMEVADAIPFNGALMHNAGVVTSFNSDSDELARHLNTEAAKAVKYGGLSETEAFKFVTLNPAKQLKIDHRTGSLEVGKDADFVIWNTNPLSTFSRAEQTWIEGRLYFDVASDARLRQEAQAERQRIAAKVIASKSNTPAAPAKSVDAEKVAAPKTPAEMLAANQAYLELQQWLHRMSQHRTGYWAGAEAHECTED